MHGFLLRRVVPAYWLAEQAEYQRLDYQSENGFGLYLNTIPTFVVWKFTETELKRTVPLLGH